MRAVVRVSGSRSSSPAFQNSELGNENSGCFSFSSVLRCDGVISYPRGERPMKVLQHLFLGAAFAVAAISIHAQTTTRWALGQAFCEHGSVYCYGIPITSGTQHASIWIDIQPYERPISSWFISGIPELANGWAQVNLDSTYHYTKTTATYTTSDGKRWTGMVPRSITLTFKQVVIESNTAVVPPHPITGTATILFGNYRYVDRCSGRGCGGALGWYYSVVGGSLTVQMH